MKRLALLAAVFFATACGSANTTVQGPSDTLRAYALALDEGRIDDAYKLLSAEAKRSMSPEAFRRAASESPEELREIAHALARPASDPVVTATVTLLNGDELVLVYESGRWRVDAAAVDLYGQSTPRKAITGFVRAFEKKRYDVLLRYVPDAERHGIVRAPSGDEASPPVQPTTELTAEKLKAAWEGPQKEAMQGVVQAIRTALPTATIEETGDTASMAFGAGGTLSFVREQGLWKIRNF